MMAQADQSAGFPDVLGHPTGGRLFRDPSRLLLHFAEEPDDRRLGAALRRLGLDSESSRPASELPLNQDAHTRWVVRPRGAPIRLRELPEILENTGARWAAPVMLLEVRGSRHHVVALPDSLVVRVVDEEKVQAVQGLLAEFGAEIDRERSIALGGQEPYRTWYVRTDPQQRTSYSLREVLLERLSPECSDVLGLVPAERSGVELLFEHAPMHLPVAFIPNDPAYADQAHWNLDRIRLTGPGRTGFDVQQEAGGVTVAVLDAEPVGSADAPVEAAVHLGSGSVPQSAGDHGSRSVGVLGSHVDNETGVTGVAGGCKVVPYVFNAWTDVELAIGIRAAADYPADVISISAGFQGWNPAVVDDAITYAHAKGVVVCAAAQNDNLDGGVTYPASHPLVIAVGATDRSDARVDTPAWGSNYGWGLSIVAPGIEIPWSATAGKAFRRRRPDRRGRDLRGDRAQVEFTEGTSAATPQVAGVAALIRALNPSLLGDDVRYLLESTASRNNAEFDTVEGYPSGPWNPQLGHGRLDALSALKDAGYAEPRYHDFWQTGGVIPASSGPVFIIPKDNCRALRLGQRPAPVLDVQPNWAEAIRSLTEHQAGGTVTDSHAGEEEADIPPVKLDDLDVFDGTGRPLEITTGPDNDIRLVRTDQRPRQAEVMTRVRICTTILEAVVRAEQTELLDTFDPPPGDPLYPLRGDYLTFEEFAWDVLLHNVHAPWAHSASFWHNLRHLW